MFTKFAIISTLALLFAVVAASPQPTPGPVDPIEFQKRQIDSVISQVTGGAGSVISQITSGAGTVASGITSAGGGVGSAATSLGGAATSAGGSAVSGASSVAASNSSSSTMAMNLHTPLLAAFATVIFSTLFGAAFVL